MAETQNKPLPEFEILTQFIKDLSFETPSTPNIFFQQLKSAPQVSVNLEVKTQKLGDDIYEVLLVVKVNSVAEENKAVFIADLAYGIVAAIRVKDEEEIKRYITKVIPAYAFPFVRNIVADLTRDSGFSPFVLAPINFDTVEFNQNPPAGQQAPANAN